MTLEPSLAASTPDVFSTTCSGCRTMRRSSFFGPSRAPMLVAQPLRDPARSPFHLPRRPLVAPAGTTPVALEAVSFSVFVVLDVTRRIPLLRRGPPASDSCSLDRPHAAGRDD